jgi:hypothetical protein
VEAAFPEVDFIPSLEKTLPFYIRDLKINVFVNPNPTMILNFGSRSDREGLAGRVGTGLIF